MPEKNTYQSREFLPPSEEEINVRDLVYLVLQMQLDMTKLIQAFQDIKANQSLNPENKNLNSLHKAGTAINRDILSADLMTTEEVMKWLKLSKRTLQNYRNEGEIPFKKYKGRIYYSKKEIEKCFEKFKVKEQQ